MDGICIGFNMIQLCQIETVSKILKRILLYLWSWSQSQYRNVLSLRHGITWDEFTIASQILSVLDQISYIGLIPGLYVEFKPIRLEGPGILWGSPSRRTRLCRYSGPATTGPSGCRRRQRWRCWSSENDFCQQLSWDGCRWNLSASFRNPRTPPGRNKQLFYKVFPTLSNLL